MKNDDCDYYTKPEEIELLKKEIQNARLGKNATIIKHAVINKDSVKSPKAKNKILSTISFVIFSMFIVFLSIILISLISSKSKGETPTLLGYQIYNVKSGSMIPTLQVGDYFLAKIPQNANDLINGQIVTFTSEEGVTITHRIIEVIKEGDQVKYKTKGDNPNNSEDKGFLTPDRVVAIFVLKIPLI